MAFDIRDLSDEELTRMAKMLDCYRQARLRIEPVRQQLAAAQAALDAYTRAMQVVKSNDASK